MDVARTVYEHKVTWAVTLVLGMAIFIMGYFVHGDGGNSIRMTGGLLILSSLTRVSHQATADRLRDAYRGGRADRKRFGPILVEFPRREEEAADR